MVEGNSFTSGRLYRELHVIKDLCYSNLNDALPTPSNIIPGLLRLPSSSSIPLNRLFFLLIEKTKLHLHPCSGNRQKIKRKRLHLLHTSLFISISHSCSLKSSLSHSSSLKYSLSHLKTFSNIIRSPNCNSYPLGLDVSLLHIPPDSIPRSNQKKQHHHYLLCSYKPTTTFLHHQLQYCQLQLRFKSHSRLTHWPDLLFMMKPHRYWLE